MDPAALPAEVWILIFRYLPIKDLALSARVCSRWRQISEDDTLWAPFFSTSITAGAFLLEHRRKQASTSDRPFMKRAWSEMAKIERNWIQGSCQMTVLELPENRPITCALIDEPRHRLILGTMATTLELVDLPRDAANSDDGGDGGFDVAASGPRLHERSAAEPLRRAHHDAVRALLLSPDGRFVASASNDLTVRVWDADTLEARHTLTGHTDSVRVVAFHGVEGRGESRNLLLSCGRDKTVRVWDVDQGLQLHSFEHTSAAHAISVVDDTVAVGYSDATVRIWCLETGKQLQSLTGHTHWATCLQYRPGVLVSGSLDKRVIDWDLRSAQPAHVFVGHEKLINAILLHGPADDQVISCSTDGTVRLWSRGSGAHLHTLKHNPNAGQSRADRRLEVSAIASRHYATRPDVATIVAANTGAPKRSSVALWEVGTDAAASTAILPSLRAAVQPGLSDLLSLTTSPRYLVATAWDSRAVVCDFGRSMQSIRYRPGPDDVEAEQSGEEESRPYVPPWQRRQQRGQGQDEGQMPPPDLVSDE